MPVWICIYSLIMFTKVDEKVFLDWGVSLISGNGNSNWIALKSKLLFVPYRSIIDDLF